MMSMTSQIRDMAFKGASIDRIRAAAIANGMRNLAGDGRIKILKGETTPDEIARVTHSETNT
jgi:type IV pilus assembly protein PilB